MLCKGIAQVCSTREGLQTSKMAQTQTEQLWYTYKPMACSEKDWASERRIADQIPPEAIPAYIYCYMANPSDMLSYVTPDRMMVSAA